MAEQNIPAEMLDAATEAIKDLRAQILIGLCSSRDIAQAALEAAGVPALIARAKGPDTNVEFDPLFLDPDEKVDYGYNKAWREVRRLLGMADAGSEDVTR